MTDNTDDYQFVVVACICGVHNAIAASVIGRWDPQGPLHALSC